MPTNVLQDSNFLLRMQGRPLTLRMTPANMLQVCVNNDSLCLSKQNIVDYSLLAIIDTKSKKVRFGIIDYLQMYTFDRQLESTYKKVVNLGKNPTIVDPASYRQRLRCFVKCYFLGVCSQREAKPLPSNATQEERLKRSVAEMEELKQICEEKAEYEVTPGLKASLAAQPPPKESSANYPPV